MLKFIMKYLYLLTMLLLSFNLEADDFVLTDGEDVFAFSGYYIHPSEICLLYTSDAADD